MGESQGRRAKLLRLLEMHPSVVTDIIDEWAGPVGEVDAYNALRYIVSRCEHYGGDDGEDIYVCRDDRVYALLRSSGDGGVGYIYVKDRDALYTFEVKGIDLRDVIGGGL